MLRLLEGLTQYVGNGLDHSAVSQLTKDYNKYGGNTGEFWTATGYNFAGAAGGLAAAAVIGTFVPGPGWVVAGASVLAGTAINFTAEYLKRKNLGVPRGRGATGTGATAVPRGRFS